MSTLHYNITPEQALLAVQILFSIGAKRPGQAVIKGEAMAQINELLDEIVECNVPKEDKEKADPEG